MSVKKEGPVKRQSFKLEFCELVATTVVNNPDQSCGGFLLYWVMWNIL